MTAWTRIRNWFLSKRSLVGQLDDFEALVAKQIDEIAGLRAEATKVAEATTTRIEFLQRAIHGLRRSVQAEYRLRTEAEAKLTRIADELRSLRDDIAREAQAELLGIGIHPNLPSAAGPGMARIANQPMPWQDADANRTEDI